MNYKCECKEFNIDKATIVIVDDKVVILESYCKDCNTYGKEVKEFDIQDGMAITLAKMADLKAGIIIIDYIKNTLFAKGIKDSTGYNQKPVFKQGGQESESQHYGACSRNLGLCFLGRQ